MVSAPLLPSVSFRRSPPLTNAQMSAATVTADADVAPLATPKTKSGTQYTLLIDALSLARTSLAEQSRLLGDTQDRVQQLVSAQQRLQELAAVEVKKRRAVAAHCQELEALNSEANGDPKLLARVAELRKQVGAIVRECVSHVKSGECIRAWHGVARPPALPLFPPPTPLTLHGLKRGYRWAGPAVCGRVRVSEQVRSGAMRAYVWCAGSSRCRTRRSGCRSSCAGRKPRTRRTRDRANAIS